MFIKPMKFFKIFFISLFLFINIGTYANDNAKKNEWTKLLKGNAILPDTIFIGQNEFVNSLSNNFSGLFYLINNNILAKDLNVIIKADLIAESGAIILNTPRTTGSGTHFIKIYPQDTSVYTIRGNNKFLIQIKNVDSLIFGNPNYSKPNLIFQNTRLSTTDTNFVFTVRVDANQNVYTNHLKFYNCIFKTNTQTKYSVGFYIKSFLDPILLTQGKLENLEFNYCEFDTHIGIDLTDLSTFYKSIYLKNVLISKCVFKTSILGSSISAINVKNLTISNNNFEPTLWNNNLVNIPNCIDINNYTSSAIYNNKFIANMNASTVGFRFINMTSSRVGFKYIYNNVFISKTISDNYSTNSALITSNTDSVDFINNTCFFYIDGVYTTNVLPRSVIEVSSGNNFRIINNSLQTEGPSSGYPQSLVNYFGKKLIIKNNHFSNYQNNYLLNVNDTLYANNKLPSLYSLYGENTLIDKLVINRNTGISASSILNAKGIPISYINTDYNGTIRPSKPSLGAYELQPRSFDLAIEKIHIPNYSILLNNTDSLVFSVVNNSEHGISNYTVVAKIESGAFSDSVQILFNDTINAFDRKVISIKSIPFQQFTQTTLISLKLIQPLDTFLQNNVLSQSVCVSTLQSATKNEFDSIISCYNQFQRSATPVFYSKNRHFRMMDWYDKEIDGNYLGRAPYLSNIYDTVKYFYAKYADNRFYAEPKISNSGSNTYKVVVFMVKNTNTKPITIQNMFFKMANANSAQYNVYLKNGNFVGAENTSSLWSFYATLNMPINNNIGELMFNTPATSKIIIQPGDSLSFYISWMQSGSNNNFLCQNSTSNFSATNNNLFIRVGSAKVFNSFLASTISNVIPNIEVNGYFEDNCMYNSLIKIKAIPQKYIHDSYITATGNHLSNGLGTYESPDTLCVSDTVQFSLNPVYSYVGGSRNDWIIQDKYIKNLYTNSIVYFNNDTSLTIKHKLIQNNNNQFFRIEYKLRHVSSSCYINIYRNLLLLKTPALPSLGNDTLLCKGDSLILTNDADKNQKFYWSTGDTTRSIVVRNPGTYYLEVDFANCRKLRDSITVTFKDQLDSLKIDHWFAWCLYQFKPDSFIANSTYFWDFGDNQFSTDSMPMHKYAFDGIYKVKMTVQTPFGTCLKLHTTTKTIYNSCFVGLEQLNEKNIEIYPNPTKDKIYIKGVNDETIVNLYDIQSKLINSYVVKNQIEIDISQLDNGVYILKVGALTKRILKY